MGISVFHSISSFNNAGFDILGGFRNLAPYRGLGFYVIKDIIDKHTFKKLSLHSKIVLSVTGVLLLTGTLMLRLSDSLPWNSAFFHSVSGLYHAE